MSRLFTFCRFGRQLSRLKGIPRSALIPSQYAAVQNISSGIHSTIGSRWIDGCSSRRSPAAQILRSLSSSLPADGTELHMPALSPTMETGGIVSWLKKEGDKVSPGDAIAEIETDKATLEWDMADGGYIAKILYPAGAKDVPVGTCVAIMVDEEKDVAAYKDYKHEASAPAGAAPTTPPSAATVTPKPVAAEAAKEYPEHIIIGFPALSPTMESGSLGAWVKKEGDYIASGDTLCTIVTDKATNDFECLEEGYLAKILVADGAEGLAVGVPIAVIVEEKESAPAFVDFSPPSESEQPAVAEATREAPPVSPATPSAPVQDKPITPGPALPKGGRIIASPYAKKLASEASVNLDAIEGSGPGGRIVAADVQDLMSRGGMAPARQVARDGSPYIDVPLTQIRRVIAARLTESKQTIPHYYLTVDCVVNDLIEFRRQLNAKLEKEGHGVKLSLNDFIIKAAALALKSVPEVNSSWQGDFIRQFNAADISVAVQTPTGLMVPIVKNADAIGLQAISSEVKSLAEKAKNGKLRPEEYTGGTFTISNLGMFGIKQFCAIVNPPQAAILAVGGTQPRLVKDSKTNDIREETLMSCTLSCDHRVIDGAVGATWLKEFRNYVEQPVMMLL